MVADMWDHLDGRVAMIFVAGKFVGTNIIESR
jgi:hypothetical protein